MEFTDAELSLLRRAIKSYIDELDRVHTRIIECHVAHKEETGIKELSITNLNKSREEAWELFARFQRSNNELRKGGTIS